MVDWKCQNRIHLPVSSTADNFDGVEDDKTTAVTWNGEMIVAINQISMVRHGSVQKWKRAMLNTSHHIIKQY